MEPKKRVAIVFFGLGRGIPLTIESIKNRIYACNPDFAFSFFTIASLNLVDEIHNPRTGEDGATLDAADAYLLDADAYMLVRQSDAAIAGALRAAQRRRDPFTNTWISVRNTLHQLASLRRAWALCAEQGGFDHYLFIRPDLIYLDDFKLTALIGGLDGEGCIALPAWHGWGGLNDRFALADATAARAYAERLTLVPEYCAADMFHPERFLAYALAKAGCRVCALPVRARRVRANGAIVDEDFSAAVNDLPDTPERLYLRAGPAGSSEEGLVFLEYADRVTGRPSRKNLSASAPPPDRSMRRWLRARVRHLKRST
jgi:hypothetical protein